MSAIPFFGVDAEQSRIVSDWALSQRYTRDSDKLLEQVIKFEECCSAARYASRWPETRANMSRADWSRYALRCESLAKSKTYEASKAYDEIVRLILL